MRQGDFSFRVHEPEGDTAPRQRLRELNDLSELLLQQHLGSMEATALLRAVMSEIDVAVFAFDGEPVSVS